jgi:hypothetical protein
MMFQREALHELLRRFNFGHFSFVNHVSHLYIFDIFHNCANSQTKNKKMYNIAR